MSAQTIGEIEHFSAFVAFVRACVLMTRLHVFLEVAFLSESTIAHFTREIFHLEMHHTFVLAHRRLLPEKTSA